MTHTHTYDEHGLCFECDKPQSKAAMMKRLRAQRKEQGLTHYRAWVTEAEKKHLERSLKELRGVKNGT